MGKVSNIRFDWSIQPRLQLLDHLAFEDSALIKGFGCAESTQAKRMQMILVEVTGRFRVIRSVGMFINSYLHISHGLTDLITAKPVPFINYTYM